MSRFIRSKLRTPGAPGRNAAICAGENVITGGMFAPVLVLNCDCRYCGVFITRRM